MSKELLTHAVCGTGDAPIGLRRICDCVGVFIPIRAVGRTATGGIVFVEEYTPQPQDYPRTAILIPTFQEISLPCWDTRAACRMSRATFTPTPNPRK